MPKETLEKTKNFARSKLGEAIMLVSMAGLSILLTLIIYSAELVVVGKGNTLWSVTEIMGYTYILHDTNIFFIIAFAAKLALAIVAAVLSFVKRKKILYCVYAGVSFALDIVLMAFQLFLALFDELAIVCLFVDLLLMVAMMAILLVKIKREKKTLVKEPDPTAEVAPEDEERDVALLPARVKTWRKIMRVCECVATVAMFVMLVMPIYSTGSSAYSLIQSLTKRSLPTYFKIAFLAVFVGCIVGLLYFVSLLSYVKTKHYYKKSKTYVYGVAYFTLAFFVAGYAMNFIINVSQTESATAVSAIMSLLPFIFALASMLVHSIALGRCAADIETGEVLKSTSLKVEPLIYVSLMTAALFSTLMLSVVAIKASVGSFGLTDTSLSGLELLTNYADLGGGFQLVSFLLYAILLTSSVMLLISLFSFLSKSKDYYRIVKTAAFTNLAFSILIGLFGVYFRIAQEINIDNIESLMEMFGIGGYIDYSYELTSQTMIVLVACGLIFAIMLFRKQFNLAVDPTEMEVSFKNPKDARALSAATSAASPFGQSDDATPFNFDSCPAFTELDGKLPELNATLQAKRQQLFENFTLPNLVRFVVDYARESRLHLSYSLEDMATFVAGLGASRLTILQGMSGTGKTSLPKIFTEAVMGVCEIVEVESSWRDKNELLGYYNEFSKCFTPKKFTQCLYKARLNSSVLTLIVLDEMNLSRIEYYFSDFLSLMEHEPDKREIKLLNIKLGRFEEGALIPYKGLTDGHTIKMPQNVWFVGTANRDESTFAISDKVYDRAQTMNFNKRAPKIHSFSEPLEPKFASYDMFISLFDEAKSSMKFDAEENPTVQKVEKILAPYNISFGNRILKQMEDFVKIYCACFGDKNAVLKEAVEKILLSKVVSKLENKVVENKEALATEFDRLGLAACADFVRKLNED